MSLYDRAVDLQLKIEATQSADASADLLARATRLVTDLATTSTYLEAATKFRTSVGATDMPPVDTKAVSQAIGAFRGGLSRHGANAFQHQPASTLVDVAREQQRKVTRWVTGHWKSLFANYDPLIERVSPGQLIGNPTHRVTAQSRASTLRSVRGLDPVSDAAEIGTKLRAGPDVQSWVDSARAIGADLHAALQALDAERAALMPEVEHALSAAASDEGLGLSDVTAELLAALRAAGVDEHLVVRRQ
jgi:hypothetical protein